MKTETRPLWLICSITHRHISSVESAHFFNYLHRSCHICTTFGSICACTWIGHRGDVTFDGHAEGHFLDSRSLRRVRQNSASHGWDTAERHRSSVTCHNFFSAILRCPLQGQCTTVMPLQWIQGERDGDGERERESCCWCNNIAVRVSGIFYLQSHPPQQIYLSLTSIKESIRDVNNYKPSNLMWIINHRVEREKEGGGKGGGGFLWGRVNTKAT